MRPLVAIWLLGLFACQPNSENSAACGFASIAGASMTLQFLRNQHAWLRTPPPDLKESTPARVVGYGTSRALVSQGSAGLVLGYEGQGFPATPGFGLLLVDDSSEVVRGVLIYDKEEQEGIPNLGTISGATSTIPLYGLRVNWGSVSDTRCPLFAADTTSKK
ncbi:MAG: hypothetical protein HY560_01615 [Gemmatimonadetes bacterium]|nr:hypothetical protein [Gemmatimonadota bacterium]